ncbi:hypothetical protein [Streptomyces globisporus]|uniref:hypothetical protein n=1 Tax=Streptomyces globisporus TaxID=1908 RepID=UPI000AA39AD9|nr:hypothetical protein [Streptomyces globisporus]
MSHFMYDVMGGTVGEPDPETMRRVLDGLAQADDEHSEVSLAHEGGWCLSAFGGGLVGWWAGGLVGWWAGKTRMTTRRLRRRGGMSPARRFSGPSDCLHQGIASIEAMPWWR